MVKRCAFGNYRSLGGTSLPDALASDFACSKYAFADRCGDNGGFTSYAGLRRIVLPRNLALLCSCVFSNTASVGRVALPSALGMVGDTFGKYDNLLRLRLPDKLARLKDVCNYDSLGSLIVPRDMARMNSFEDYARLRSVALPSKLTK